MTSVAARNTRSHRGDNNNSGSNGPRARPGARPILSTENMTWKLLGVLEDHDNYRRAVWPRPGDRSTGETKISWCERVARTMLEDNTEYADLVEKELRFYGNSVKGKLRKLQVLYKQKKEEMGETGAGLGGADEITEGSDLANKWEEIQKECPYFYTLRNLLGERPNISEPCRANGTTQLDLSSLDPSAAVGDNFGLLTEEDSVHLLEEPERVLIGLDEDAHFELEESQGVDSVEEYHTPLPSPRALVAMPATSSVIQRSKRKAMESTAEDSSTPSKRVPSGKLKAMGTGKRSWASEVKDIVDGLLSRNTAAAGSSTELRAGHTSNSVHDSSKPNATESMDIQYEKLALERERMQHEKEMLILRWQLENGGRR
ncbi:hypothetical protein EDC01DRAFT_636106 [Geopyxis carbonaria]|nr:hypothetical protein EDC01DRAFT_636106 [Geopyxis carbonaria]